MSYNLTTYHSPILHIIRCCTCKDIRDRHDWVVVASNYENKNDIVGRTRIAFCSENCANMFILSGEKPLDWKYKYPQDLVDDGLDPFEG